MGLPEQDFFDRNSSRFVYMEPAEMSQKLGVDIAICKMAQEALMALMAKINSDALSKSVPKTVHVFCSECKWFRSPIGCYAPSNLIDTYAFPKWEMALRPESRNKNNECELFEKGSPNEKRSDFEYR